MEQLKQSGDGLTDVLQNNVQHETDKRGSSTDSHAMDSNSLHWVFHVRHAWSNLHQSCFKQPWDFSMTSANSDCLEPWKKKLKVTGNLGPQSIVDSKPEPEIPVVASIYKEVGLKLSKKIDEKVWEQKLSYERKAAYKKWLSLVLMEVGAWTISRLSPGQDIFNFMGGSLAQSVQDALGIKATSTLHARANPLIRYAAFLKGMGVPAFPVREEAVYMFLKSNPQLAPTFPKSLMTSIAFAKYVLGLTGCDEALSSGRIRGVVAVRFTIKRKLTQRPPLTVDQIRSLEFTVIDKNKSAMDRIAAGFFLLLIFGRLRFSDAQSISEMRLDKVPGSDHGYLECGAERCKTSLTMEKKVRLLPVVVPTMSFSVDGWVEDWMDLRKQQKMELGAGKPLLPTPTVEGTWGKVPLSCEAAGDWLRGLVKEKPGGKVRIATHSCKSSILSMAAKFGLEPSTRRYLGYHSSGRDRSMLIYSRDAMAHPVREMERMIEAINENRFDPDATRSGYFMGAPVPVESKDCESSSSSGSSQDEEEFNHTDDETAVNKVVGDWGHQAVGGEQQTFYRHKTSRCLHATCDEGGNHFTCGRSISTRYARETEKPKFLHPLCSKCFKV